jgi:hypothetical protein
MMSRAFFTGSRVYGAPKPASDWDLVVLMDESDMRLLRECLSKRGDESAWTAASLEAADRDESDVTCRFGVLNLIATSSQAKYDAWRKGTTLLSSMAGIDRVTRDQAKALFKPLFDAARAAHEGNR